MERTIDCIGMACPLPVINAKKAIEAFTEDGTLTIKVDNETAVQNLTRLGEHNGFKVTSTKDGERAFTVTMAVRAGAGKPAGVPAEALGCQTPAGSGRVVVLSADTMGGGDEKLGRKLMKAFIFALTSQDVTPDKVICYNTGARLTTLDAELSAVLANVPNKDIITFHEAFPYFAEAYGLHVAAVVNRDPDDALSPRALAELCKTVTSLGTPPLFTEPQYEDVAAQTISRETGASIHTLDPIVTGPEKDIPLTYYEDVMRQNLAVLLSALSE